ncbi:hypothetical protein [Xanthocytophaga agilis]|uniref:Uncharacterized protein n=1 Tax=Xanthocytophaga agilis TaxID=3048010 RepID=A0AAE3R576_9BACT|nr:hypothetical protein [Xanthocytophaga agilis]MDJ1501649.1 hypothetical protein [Xanthocytophaga agilis]
MQLSPNSEPAATDAGVNLTALRDSFYAFSNVERNTVAALENYVLRGLPQQRSSVIIGCRESFLVLHLAKFFSALVAVEEDANLLAEITAQEPKIVACQIEPDDFKLIGRTDLIVISHLLQSLGAWLETPEERNHQRMAFLNHYYGSLETEGALLFLQNRPQNNYKQLLEFLSCTPSQESQMLFEQINKQYTTEHYLFPVEIYTQRAEDMIQALSYLLLDNNIDWTEKAISLQTYVKTLLQLDGNYYFNYEGEITIMRKKA